MKRTLPTLLIGLFLIVSRAAGQCSMVPVDLQNRLSNSSLVVEGKVIAQKSFWNNAGNYIYTSNLIEVYSVFKGILISNKLEIITDGGMVGMQKQVVEPSLELGPNDIGVFTLNNTTNSSQFGFDTYTAFADMQGFIKYDLRDNSASEPFFKYNSIQNDLFSVLQSALNIKIRSSLAGSANK